MQLEVGAVLEGKVSGITKFGAFVDLPEGKTGMVHISEVSNTYVKEISDHLTMGQMVKVKVLSISPEGKIALSIKKCAEPPADAPASRGPRTFERRGGSSQNGTGYRSQVRTNAPPSFEDMMASFKKASDDKMSDLKRGGMETRRPRRQKGE
jgi:S1 RNA binding domain protein